jgi:flagellar hook-associated protein 1 FlgK
MSGTFSGLEIGRRALDYFRQGIETAGHNISNADVEGYSRQRVEAAPADPYAAVGFNSPGSPGQVGTGVEVSAISRIRDSFLDAQFRQESIEGGYWEALSRTMEYLEMFVCEPSGTGLSASLDNFVQALHEFQKRPDSGPAREVLLREAENLSSLMGQISGNFSEYRDSLNTEIELRVGEANSLIDRIAALSGQISRVQAMGNSPNDLMDRRDLLVEQLARLVDVSVYYSSVSNEYLVDVGGKNLVQGSEARHLVLVPQEGNGGLFDVQVENNLFSTADKPEVAVYTVLRKAAEGIHTMEVEHSATETRWAAGAVSGVGCFASATESLGLDGGFTLQVGTDGMVASSGSVPGGVVLDAPGPGDALIHLLRIGAGGAEKTIEMTWDGVSSVWMLDGTVDAGEELTLSELASYINSAWSGPVTARVDGGRIFLESHDGYLVSVTDARGRVSDALGMTRSSPAVSIEVNSTDSLQTIANRINSAYGSEGGPARPEEWLHATVEQTHGGLWYLKLESNLVGEAYRINVGPEDGISLYTARNLGLVDPQGATRYSAIARDALFTVDGMKYLSSTNAFGEARLVTSFNNYRADTMQTVIGGVTIRVNGEGSGGLRVEKHVTGGFIEGLLVSRDDVILGMQSFLDDFAKTLSDQFNALHYSGHGIGARSDTTGVAFFMPLDAGAGAASSLRVNSAILSDISLLAAASGDGNGHSRGIGDGNVALSLIELFEKPIFSGGSVTIDGHYASFVASLGSRSRQAAVMNENQSTLLSQISQQRSSISGVNVDEEMMDLIKFQQSYKAVSRYVTVLDELLDKVINGMGIVGR